MKKLLIGLIILITAHSAHAYNTKKIAPIGKKAAHIAKHCLAITCGAAIATHWTNFLYRTNPLRYGMPKESQKSIWYGTPVAASYIVAGYAVYNGLSGLEQELDLRKKLAAKKNS